MIDQLVQEISENSKNWPSQWPKAQSDTFRFLFRLNNSPKDIQFTKQHILIFRNADKLFQLFNTFYILKVKVKPYKLKKLRSFRESSRLLKAAATCNRCICIFSIFTTHTPQHRGGKRCRVWTQSQNKTGKKEENETDLGRTLHSLPLSSTDVRRRLHAGSKLAGPVGYRKYWQILETSSLWLIRRNNTEVWQCPFKVKFSVKTLLLLVLHQILDQSTYVQYWQDYCAHEGIKWQSEPTSANKILKQKIISCIN